MNPRIVLPAVALLIALPIAAGCGGGGAAPQAVSHQIQFKTPVAIAAQATQPAASSTGASNAATVGVAVAAPSTSPTPAATTTPEPTSAPTQAAAAQPAATQPATTPAAAETPAATPPPAAPVQPVQFTLVTTDEAFSTTSLSVKVNQPVTIIHRNDGKEIHNFALCQSTDCGAFVAEGDLLASGKQAQVTFTLTQPGTYKFECEVHTKTMVGTVVVS